MLWRFIVISSLRQIFHTNSYLEKKNLWLYFTWRSCFFSDEVAKSDNKLQFAYRELNKWNATRWLTVVINILRGKKLTLIYTKSKHCVTRLKIVTLNFPNCHSVNQQDTFTLAQVAGISDGVETIKPTRNVSGIINDLSAEQSVKSLISWVKARHVEGYTMRLESWCKSKL